MNSQQLKTAALAWLRYGRQYKMVCTEVGPMHCDVLGLNSKIAVEIEVKVSISDLKREFIDKSAKHYLYSNVDKAWYLPNYFYFLLPEDIIEKARPIIEEQSPKTGIGVFTNYNRHGENVSIVKKPTKIHTNPPSTRLIDATIARMSSELVGLHVSLDGSIDMLYRSIEGIKTGVLDRVKEAAGALDCEDLNEDLFNRAAKIAMAVEGIPVEEFRELPEQNQRKWFSAAMLLLDRVNDEKLEAAIDRNLAI